MRIEWSEIAFDDLSNIQDYIAKDSPYYADQFIDKLMVATEKLSDTVPLLSTMKLCVILLLS